jgi:hypothetical protein
MNRFEGRKPNRMQSGGLAHFVATIVFWLAAGVGIGRSEANHREHLV